MIIECGEISKARKLKLKEYLRQNKMYLESIFEDDINLPSILVKFVEETDFEEIWKRGRCDPFYEDFLGLICDRKDKRDETNNLIDKVRDDYFEGLRDVLNKIYTEEVRYCEPIVAFVSDLNFKEKELNDKHPEKIITSPGIYVKKKDDDIINLDFGILYSLIKAQIYYSMSRTDILRKYRGIDSVIYSAMALNVMGDSEFKNLLKHQKNARINRDNGLAGSWAIPLDLLILASKNRGDLDNILDDDFIMSSESENPFITKPIIDEILVNDLVRRVFFGEDIDEDKWLEEITRKVCRVTSFTRW